MCLHALSNIQAFVLCKGAAGNFLNTGKGQRQAQKDCVHHPLEEG